MSSRADLLQSAILGLCIGDALGVPVEFQARRLLDKNPVTDMMGYGTYNQPPGTWSDDSSLTLCLIDSLSGGYDLRDIGKTFVRWHRENLWTPHGVVFDIGFTTREAMYELYKQEKLPLQLPVAWRASILASTTCQRIGLSNWLVKRILFYCWKGLRKFCDSDFDATRKRHIGLVYRTG